MLFSLCCTLLYKSNLDKQSLENPLGLLAISSQSLKDICPIACFPEQLMIHIDEPSTGEGGRETFWLPYSFLLNYYPLFLITTKLNCSVQGHVNHLLLKTKQDLRISVASYCNQRNEVARKFIKIKEELMIPANAQCLSSQYISSDSPFCLFPAERPRRYKCIETFH